MLPAFFKISKKIFAKWYTKETNEQIFIYSETIILILISSEKALTAEEIIIKTREKLSTEVSQSIVLECLDELVHLNRVIESKNEFNDSVFGINSRNPTLPTELKLLRRERG
jgi:hypothetical protein